MSRYNDINFKYTKTSSVSNSIEEKGYRKGFKEGYIQGELHVIETTFNLMAYTMNYKLGFGKKRLFELLRAIYLNIDSFRSGQLSKEDYIEIQNELKEKGITLEEILNTIK